MPKKAKKNVASTEKKKKKSAPTAARTKKKTATPARKRKTKAKTSDGGLSLESVAVTLGMALGRTERAAVAAKKTIEDKLAALGEQWKKARAKSKRKATRSRGGRAGA